MAEKMDYWSTLSFMVNMDQMCPHCEEDLSYSDVDQVECSYGKVYKTMIDCDSLPDILPEERKSGKLSEELRNKGNQAYGAKDNQAAIEWYTKAVCAAPLNSKEIALAFANRSAVTFELQEFNDSIRDIDHALSSGSYPDNLKHKLHERRGRCFLALSQFSKALADFKMTEGLVQRSGLAQEKMDSLITQIDSLIESCSDRPDLPQKSFVNPIRLSHKPSSYIQSASSDVDIKHSSKMGREIIANTNIKPGDVLAIEKYYASALLQHCLLDHCDNCMMKCFSPVPCTSCKTVVYCSEDCRQSSWMSCHSVECSILPSLYAYCNSSKLKEKPKHVMKMRLALRIFLVASSCGTDIDKMLKKLPKPSDPSKAGFVNGKYLSNDYSSICQLVSYIESTDDEYLVAFAAQATALVVLLRKCTKFFQRLNMSGIAGKQLFSKRTDCGLKIIHLTVAYLLTKISMMVSINCIAVQEPGSAFRQIGGALYPFCSLFNHSCDPNVMTLPYSCDTIFVMATQPIHKGQQAFVSYGFGYREYTRVIRRESLKTLQHFTCQCPPCVEDWHKGKSSDMPVFKRPAAKDRTLQLAKHVENIFDDVMKGNGTEEHLTVLVEFITLVHNSVKPPWEPYAKAQDMLIYYMASRAHPDLSTESADCLLSLLRERTPEVPPFLIPKKQPIRMHLQL